VLHSRVRQMTAWQRWVQRPQSLWMRKALVQVHLWVGIGGGLYVLLISISGSAIVYRRELGRRSRKAVIVAERDRRMGLEELQRHAQRAYPSWEVYGVYESKRPDQPDEVVFGNDSKRIARLFDPYTGVDLGDPRSPIARMVEWLVDLHDNLLTGASGRFVSGIGAFLVTLVSLTGVVIWWPGIKNWRRSLTVRRAKFVRFNWDLHSAMGFWCSSFLLLWGISGMCLCFPGVLNPLLSHEIIYWITRLHFGGFNWATKAIWTILGLTPAIPSITGTLMWYSRVLRKKIVLPN
jgi:uncharacterized iron-regulated membrane protein